MNNQFTFFFVGKKMCMMLAFACTVNSLHSRENHVVSSRGNGQKVIEGELLAGAMHAIQNGMKKATGTPYMVSCQCKVKNDKAITAHTEVHYTDYRKKCDVDSSVEYSTDVLPQRVVEFVYKPNNGTLAVVEKDPENLYRRIATHRMKVSIRGK